MRNHGSLADILLNIITIETEINLLENHHPLLQFPPFSQNFKLQASLSEISGVPAQLLGNKRLSK